MPVELAVDVGPLTLTHPVICGSGEHLMTFDQLVGAVDAGAAAVVAKSANESEAARRQLRSAAYALSIRPGTSFPGVPRCPGPRC
jgi:dihydroorotate dehydrogenase (NAD+) catalytic subunit